MEMWLTSHCFKGLELSATQSTMLVLLFYTLLRLVYLSAILSLKTTINIPYLTLLRKIFRSTFYFQTRILKGCSDTILIFSFCFTALSLAPLDIKNYHDVLYLNQALSVL